MSTTPDSSTPAAPPRYLLDATGALITRITAFDTPADAVLAQFRRDHPKLGARDRQRVADAAFAALRHWRLMQLWLDQDDDAAKHTSTRAALLAHALLSQLPLLTRWRHADAAAVIRQAQAWSQDDANAAWLARCLQGHTGEPTQALADAYQHQLPDWLAERLQLQWQDAFWPLVQALRQPAPLDLRVNPMRHKRNQAQALLLQDGIEAQSTALSPWGLRLHGKVALRDHPLMQGGAIEVQDEGSQLLALLTDARRGETVVDFCAGAGGKTLALGSMMRGTGRLYAFDTSAHRLGGLQPRLARSGLSNVHTMVLQTEADARLQRLHGKADRVLVDAPCSGLGTLRRHPELAWRQQPGDIAALQAQQLRILTAASALLKPGGVLVYATCSLLDEENAQVRDQFSAQVRDFAPLDWLPILKKHGLEHLLPTPTSSEGGANGLTLSPHLHQTDGFFIAGWRKMQ